jgi:hypothetical protein
MPKIIPAICDRSFAPRIMIGFDKATSLFARALNSLMKANGKASNGTEGGTVRRHTCLSDLCSCGAVRRDSDTSMAVL